MERLVMGFLESVIAGIISGIISGVIVLVGAYFYDKRPKKLLYLLDRDSRYILSNAAVSSNALFGPFVGNGTYGNMSFDQVRLNLQRMAVLGIAEAPPDPEAHGKWRLTKLG